MAAGGVAIRASRGPLRSTCVFPFAICDSSQANNSGAQADMIRIRNGLEVLVRWIHVLIYERTLGVGRGT